MLTLSKRVEYALMAILHMADVPECEWSSAKGIAERYAIPPELMGKVLQALARAGLVRSSPGVGGGYRLAKPLGAISLGTVIEAVEGPVSLTVCQNHPEDCHQFATCSIREPVQQLHAQLREYIYSIPLDRFRAPQPAGGMA